MLSLNTLSDLSPGDTAQILKLLNKGSMRRRLLDIGFIEGETVTCLFKSPSGDPTAYLIKGAVIALRKDDSSNIKIDIPGGE